MSNEAQTMKKKNKRTLTPKLRFPEFRDKPGWEEKPLDSVCSPVERKRPKPDDHYIRLGVRSHGKGTFLKPNEDPSKNSMDYLYEVYENDLILNITFAWEGAIAIAQSTDTGALVSHRFPTYVFNLGVALPEFFQYHILNKRFIYDLGVISPGGAGRNRVLNKTDFLKLKLPIPGLKEQQKIADCLGSLDGLIAAEGRKLEALKAHKKGLMQQLFPQSGETQPRLRFPEFRDKGEWGESPLSKLLSRKPEYGVNAAAVPFSEDLPIYIRITDIDDEGQFTQDNRVSVDIEPTEENYLVEGDIVLARTGASVGKSYRYRQKDGRLVFAGFLIRVRPNHKKLVTDFLSNYLTTWQYWDWVRLTSARSGQPGINGSEYASMPVPLPPTGPKGNELAEQQKIADCLSALGTQIAAQAEKIESLKQHKRGLMQQLFPMPEEH